MWSLQRDFSLEVRWLGDEALVFHCGSGETHRLNQGSGALLQILIEQSKPLDEEQLHFYMKQKDSCAFNMDIVPVLEELQRLQIIETV